jgi:hypothetical protein
VAEATVADGVDAAMDAVEAAGADPALHSLRAESNVE